MPMNCDLAIEYLPWLLNGTLEAGERDEVRRHLETCESCRAALNDTREAWTIFGQHLPSDALVALAYGEAPAGVDTEIAERHLASCPECAAELELARTSRHLEEDARLAVFPTVPSNRPGAPERADRSRSWRIAAIAAGLLAIVSSAGWVHQLQQASDAGRIARAVPSTPAPAGAVAGNDSLRKQLDALVASLGQLKASQEETAKRAEQDEAQLAEIRKQNEMPRSGTFAILDMPDVMRGAEPPTTAPKALHRSSLPFTLLLQASREADGPPGRKAEIVDATGKTLRVEETLTPSENYYSLALPAGFLKPGRYTVRLRSPRTGEARESYRIVVE
jgi:anti-sigma factor RsiW